MTRSQSAITCGRVPGRPRISFSVLMAAHSIIGSVGVTQKPAAALGVLTGLNVLNYLDRYMGAALLPLIIAGLHLTDAQAGSLQSIFILVYSLVSPAMGW